jgi:hypothetical protein
MENPYQPPGQPLLPPVSGFHWRRVVVWSWLLLLVPTAVGLISGLSMSKWEMYAPTIEEAIASARLVRRVGIFVVTVIVFWRFAAGVTSKLLLHVLALFALEQVIELSFSLFVFEVPVRELVDGWATLRDFLAALIGFGIAWSASGFRNRMSTRSGLP